MTGVELADIAASEFLHQASNGSNFRRRGEQVLVAVHQDVCMQFAACVEQRFTQQRQIALPVVVVKNAGQWIVAALDNTLRYPGQVEPWLSPVN